MLHPNFGQAIFTTTDIGKGRYWLQPRTRQSRFAGSDSPTTETAGAGEAMAGSSRRSRARGAAARPGGANGANDANEERGPIGRVGGTAGVARGGGWDIARGRVESDG